MQRDKIIATFEKEIADGLSSKGISRVIAGVSGGADSVALLRALISVGISVEAVHCNFHLRGEESERDCRFVKTLCSDHNVSLDVVDFDVAQYRRHHGGSVEMACRELRYAYFEKKMAEFEADRIAVAHNADDNAETVLLNLFRGSGIAGLRAMKPDTGRIIRPLIQVSRMEIEEYLNALRQEFIVDSSNLSSDYRRNFLRNEVIPLIEKGWPGVKQSLNKTAAIMLSEEEGIENLIGDIVGAESLSYGLLNDSGGKWILRRFVKSKGGTDEIVEEMWASLSKIEIRKGARWSGVKGEFIFGPSGVEWLEGLPLPEGIELGGEFEWKRFRNSSELLGKIKNDRSNSTLWISVDPSKIRIRTRVGGDRMKPLGMTGSRLVSDIISDSRLPSREKRRLAVAENMESGEILWVENLKRSRKDLVSENDDYIWCLNRKCQKS